MSMSDPIADMLTRVRNALMARFSQVDIPHSKTKEAIAAVLKSEGFIEGYQVVPREIDKLLRIDLKYQGNKSVIEGIQRVSRPSRRVYVPHDGIPRVRNGLGVSILSTNRGVMSDKTARDTRVGGEILCEVW